MSLRLARVAAVHPEDHSVDLVMVDNGERFAGVQTLTGSASTNSGTHDMPTPSTPAAGKWDMTERTDCDMIAVVGFTGKFPIVMGFLYPQVSQMLFSDPNRKVMRHASDVYTTIDGQGNSEFYHPSGAYIRIGTSSAHEDLSGKNADGSWAITKNTGNQVHIHVEQAGGKASVDIAPSGAITITTQSTVDVTADGNVTVKTPSAKVDAPETHCTGNLTVDGQITGKGGMAISGGTHQTPAMPITR